jgi:hypothetical protein
LVVNEFKLKLTPPPGSLVPMLAQLSESHPTILRALSSRLGEVRDVSAAWRERSPDGSGEPALLRALRLVRSECHEWTASDVLRSLTSQEGGELLVVVGDEEEGGSGGGGAALCASPLVRGLPAWSWPAYPRAPWLRHLCPVLESLLSSCYEDWVLAALTTTRATLAALAPMLQLASAQCTAEDLAPPPPQPAPAPEGEGGGGSGGGGREAVAVMEERAMRHAAATGAASFARLAAPLLAALSSAAQCPSPGTQRAAAQLAADLRGVLLRLQHLTSDA